jgi:uncharacterized protein
MSDFNSARNRLVWFDIPVADLDRAAAFYRALLGVQVHKESFDGGAFCVLEHGDGNGGCLVEDAAAISDRAGVLVYLNVDGRIRDALREAERLGGRIVEALHPIGPHGFRAIIVDSEGNRIALHSTADR